MSKVATQTAQVLEYLEAGHAITPIDALELFGCFRLGARIFDLRQDGHSIESERVVTPNGSHIARYRLTK